MKLESAHRSMRPAPGPGAAARKAGHRHPTVAGLGLILAAAAVYIWLHNLAGLTFPIPWPDEASFLWPAIAVERSGSLLAPQLNPYRHVLWMPPGYMVWSGLVFRLFGFSLGFARTLSCAYVLMSFVLLVLLTSQLRLASLWPTLCAAFLLSRHWVFAGNVARMESLVMMLACGGFLLLARRRLVLGGVLVGLTPLVHPNGLFLAAGATAMVLIEARRGRLALRFTPAVAASLVGFVLLWLSYSVYVASHWTEFLHDLQFQAAFKGYLDGLAGLVLAKISRPSHVVAFGLTLVGLLSAYRRDEGLLALAWLGVALGVANSFTWGFNYAVYDSLFFLVAMILGGEVLFSVATRFEGAPKRFAGIGVLVLALLCSHVAGYVESPVNYPNRMTLYDLQIASRGKYITTEADRKIRRLLNAAGDLSAPITVRFYPAGDGLLFADLEGEEVRFLAPAFYRPDADLHIVHRSRLIPELLDYFTDVQLNEQGLTETDAEPFVQLDERNGTELWLWKSTESRGRADR